MRSLAFTMAILASTAAANASGGLSCTADNDELLLSLEGGVSRGMGSALFSFSGRIELRSTQVPEDLRLTEFSREHVAQYWLDGDTLKLRLYRERDGDKPHGYVEAIVETSLNDDGDDKGEYLIAVYDMANPTDSEAETMDFTGSVTCSVE
jgi:hypothetical protein